MHRADACVECHGNQFQRLNTFLIGTDVYILHSKGHSSIWKLVTLCVYMNLLPKHSFYV
jgi:hypothetical protein